MIIVLYFAIAIFLITFFLNIKYQLVFEDSHDIEKDKKKRFKIQTLRVLNKASIIAFSYYCSSAYYPTNNILTKIIIVCIILLIGILVLFNFEYPMHVAYKIGRRLCPKD